MKIFYFLALFSSILSSCGIYRQNVVNVPLMQGKGEMQISGHAGFTGYDAQAAFSLTKNIEFIGNYSNTGTIRNNISITNYSVFNHHFAEIGGGFYKKNSSGLSKELLIIVGNGITEGSGTAGDTISGHTPPYSFSNSAQYNRFLFQADFGNSKHKFEYAISPRIFVLDYYNVINTQNDAFTNLPNTFIWSDASLTLRWAIVKGLKISGQFGITVPITGYKAGFYEASPYNASIGLMIDMNFIKSKVTE